MKRLAYLLSGAVLLACSVTTNGAGTSANSSQPGLAKPDSSPNSSKLNLLKSVALQAREESRAPLGSKPQPNRPISFATVFLSFENPITQDQTLRIEKVEVIDRRTRRSLLVSAAPQLLSLRPLEHVALDVQLHSPKAYGRVSQVQAIVTYSMNGQHQEMRSEAIAIERF